MDFFSPVGVSAIAYLHVALEALRTLGVAGEPGADIRALPEAVNVVMWFIRICSTVICFPLSPVGTVQRP